MIGWLAALIVLLAFGVTAGASDNGQNADKPKEPAPAIEPKKKQEADAKSESAVKPPEDKGAKTEEAPTKQEEPTKKQEEPTKKPEEPIKKSVVSPNLTIKLALMADPLLFPFEIEVEMDDRKAVLSGHVPTEEEKARAADVVRKIEGIDSVVNKLTVSPPLRAALAKKQDETIAHFVRDRLAKSETLKAVGFDVKAENGVVHLSGKTRFQVIALEAAEAARQVPGVRAVDTSGVQIIGKD